MSLHRFNWRVFQQNRSRTTHSRCPRHVGFSPRHKATLRLRLRPDAIHGKTTSVIGALARETRTISIVFAIVSDPIGSGFAAGYAHPSGNITGFTTNEPAVGGKWWAVEGDCAEHVRAAFLFNPATAASPELFSSSIQEAASSLAVQATAAPFRGKDVSCGLANLCSEISAIPIKPPCSTKRRVS